MQIITLYKYERADGGITVSPTEPSCEYVRMFRLVADEGKALTNGEIITSCIDVESTYNWREIDEQTDNGEQIMYEERGD